MTSLHAGLESTLQSVLTTATYLAAWVVLVAISVSVLAYDARTNNGGIAPPTKFR